MVLYILRITDTDIIIESFKNHMSPTESPLPDLYYLLTNCKLLCSPLDLMSTILYNIFTLDISWIISISINYATTKEQNI
jgi:hypothetical protein